MVQHNLTSSLLCQYANEIKTNTNGKSMFTSQTKVMAAALHLLFLFIYVVKKQHQKKSAELSHTFNVGEKRNAT